jgi:hypothetical protein
VAQHLVAGFAAGVFAPAVVSRVLPWNPDRQLHQSRQLRLEGTHSGNAAPGLINDKYQ